MWTFDTTNTMHPRGKVGGKTGHPEGIIISDKFCCTIYANQLLFS